jgi:hypothetical protein
MKMKKTASLEVDLSKNATVSVYVCRWNEGSCQLEFGDYDGDKVWHSFKVEIPNALARSMVKEVNEDLDSYDEKMEKQAVEDAAEKAAEEAERIALEQGVEDLLSDEETSA